MHWVNIYHCPHYRLPLGGYNLKVKLQLKDGCSTVVANSLHNLMMSWGQIPLHVRNLHENVRIQKVSRSLLIAFLLSIWMLNLKVFFSKSSCRCIVVVFSVCLCCCCCSLPFPRPRSLFDRPIFHQCPFSFQHSSLPPPSLSLSLSPTQLIF